MTNLENELKTYFDCKNELKSINDRLDGIKTESRNIVNNKFEVYKNGSDEEINKLKSDLDKLDKEEESLKDRRTTLLMKLSAGLIKRESVPMELLKNLASWSSGV